MFRRIYRHIHHFFTCKFSYLLISLMLLFIFRPTESEITYLVFWECWFAVVFLGAVFNCNHPFKVKVWATILGVPALTLEWISHYHSVPAFIIPSLILTILFLMLCTLSLLYNEVLNAPPTLASLRPVLCAYFMMGFLFAYAYLLILAIFPDTLQFISPKIGTHFHQRYLADVIYFSFGNLTTITAGNMAPLTRASESLFIVEAIVGQFYIGVLLAKIVTLYAQRIADRAKRASERAKKKVPARRRS